MPRNAAHLQDEKKGTEGMSRKYEEKRGAILRARWIMDISTEHCDIVLDACR